MIFNCCFSWDQRLLLLREEIAFSFGFVGSVTDRSLVSNSSDQFSVDHQYVHCSGNMFLLIPVRIQPQPDAQVQI